MSELISNYLFFNRKNNNKIEFKAFNFWQFDHLVCPIHFYNFGKEVIKLFVKTFFMPKGKKRLYQFDEKKDTTTRFPLRYYLSQTL